MPNHITNVLTIDTDDDTLRNILESIKKDEVGIGSIDFNKIIPMPESLNIESGSRSNRGLQLYQSFLSECTAIGYTEIQNIEPSSEQSEDVRQLLEKYKRLTRDDPEVFGIGKQCYENIQNYGMPTWYEWANKFWQTKWNSYGDENFQYEPRSRVINFLTAWGAPHPVIQKLSELYPDVPFSHRWADEDFAYNTGECEYLGGEITMENTPEGGSKEAFEMAADILGLELNSADTGYYENADGSGYISLETDETYELITLFEKPALFSNTKIKASEIPQGMYCYDLREGDNGGFASIEQRVKVNHAGSVVTNFPIEFGEQGFINFTDDTSPNFLGEQISMYQYLQGDFGKEEIGYEQSL